MIDPLIEIGEPPKMKDALEIVARWSKTGITYTMGRVWLEESDTLEFFSEDLCLLLEEMANEIRRQISELS